MESTTAAQLKQHLFYGAYAGWNHISDAASLHHTTCSVHAWRDPSLHVNTSASVYPSWHSRKDDISPFVSPLTAQATHGPDPIQFQPEAASVPSPPWPVWLGPLLIGQSPLQQAQPGGLGLHLRVSPFGVISGFAPWGGEGGLLLWLAVQQVLQVIQGQKVIVAFQKLLHKLHKGEEKIKFNCWGVYEAG